MRTAHRCTVLIAIALAASIPAIGSSPEPEGAAARFGAIRAASPARMYVTNYGSNTVSVVDTALNSVVATIPVGSQPAGLDASPDGRFVYVANSGGDSVSVIETATNNVISMIPVGRAPSGVAILPDGSTAYVVNSGDDSVSVIDLATNAVSATLTGPLYLPTIAGPPFFGNAPDRLAVTADGSRVYIPNTRPNNRPLSVSLAMIDTATNTVTRTPSLASIDHPGWALAGGVAISADGTTGYATAWFGYVEVFDTTTNLETSAFSLSGGGPGISLGGLAIHAGTGSLYVTAQEHNSVYVVDPVNPVPAVRVSLPASPHSVSISPDGTSAYVTLGNDSLVAVINTSTQAVVSFIPVGLYPYDAVFVTAGDDTPPAVECGAGADVWLATNVQIECHATDTAAGLADPSDATFYLSTNVPSGTETASAQTTSRAVCDLAGNCATAGPFTFKIDRRPPVISIATPQNSVYLVNQPVVAAYGCVDGGSGDSTCQGTVAFGAPIATSTAGSQTFRVVASDAVGNESTADVSYSVAYGIEVLFDQTKAVKSGSTIPVKVRLVDANGLNVSSASTQVLATLIAWVSGTTTSGVEDSGNANPDLNFRYDAAVNGYIFNLSTKGLPLGAYQLRFSAAADTTTHAVGFVVGK